MSEKISIRHLAKIFGPNPESALRLAGEGIDKDELFTRSGHTVGVYDASFDVHSGEVFVVMGLSGSGKSTLVRMLNRLIEPTSGQVLVDGQDIVQMSEEELIALRRSDIAMVFQSFALLPHLTVLENAAFGLEVAGVARNARRERAMAVLDQVGLAGNADSYPDQLSGGMQQRVGLARALATEPTILLMDEAFSALDPLIRREMQEELLKLQEQSERTVVFISHDLDEAMRIGDRIAIMEGGRVLQVGTPREILDHPATDYVQNFFRDVDVSQVYTLADVADREPPAFTLDTETGRVAGALEARGLGYGYVVDAQNRLQGVVSLESLRAAAGRPLDAALLPGTHALPANRHLAEALGKVAATSYPVPVVGRRQRLQGVVTRAALLDALERPQ